MNREPRFKYIIENKDGLLKSRTLSLTAIEHSTLMIEQLLEVKIGERILARLEYTSLTDKNKKEIYEGDFIRNKNGEVSEVEFFQGVFVTTEDMVEVGEHNNLCEVIGNKFENPNLLKNE